MDPAFNTNSYSSFGQSDIKTITPENKIGMISVIIGIIIMSISLVMVGYRLPSTKLPTSEELSKELDAINDNKIIKPPVYETGSVSRKIPISYSSSTIDATQAFNKSDFEILYDNYIKPSLEDKLLNNKWLLFDKKSNVTDLITSLICGFFGCLILILGIGTYISEAAKLRMSLKIGKV